MLLSWRGILDLRFSDTYLNRVGLESHLFLSDFVSMSLFSLVYFRLGDWILTYSKFSTILVVFTLGLNRVFRLEWPTGFTFRIRKHAGIIAAVGSTDDSLFLNNLMIFGEVQNGLYCSSKSSFLIVIILGVVYVVHYVISSILMVGTCLFFLSEWSIVIPFEFLGSLMVF